MKRLLSLMLLLSAPALAQVTIQEADFRRVFDPANIYHVYAEYSGTVDIGKPGGPHVYDFSYLSNPTIYPSFNYLCSSNQRLATRFPSGSFTFGDSPADIEKNPVFLISSGTLFVCGEATTLDSAQRYQHRTPFTIIMQFPSVYGSETAQATDHYDTTIIASAAVGNHYVSTEIGKIDGFGTLKVAGYTLQCIRIKSAHDYGEPTQDVKEFLYFTREGVAVQVWGIPITAPDSGSYTTGLVYLAAAVVVGVGPECQRFPPSPALLENYPNPFNPSTTIRYTLAHTGFVKLAVYDVLGREVAVLVNGEQEAGKRDVRFDGSARASGMYVARLWAGRTVQSLKLLLNK